MNQTKQQTKCIFYPLFIQNVHNRINKLSIKNCQNFKKNLNNKQKILEVSTVGLHGNKLKLLLSMIYGLKYPKLINPSVNIFLKIFFRLINQGLIYKIDSNSSLNFKFLLKNIVFLIQKINNQYFIQSIFKYQLKTFLIIFILSKAQAPKTMMTFQQKKNAFAVEIRREQKQNKLKGLRRKYFDFIPSGISLYDLIEHFDLKNQEDFNEQRIQSDPFILVHILLAKKQNLINITFKRNQMVDQKIIIDHEDLQEVMQIKLPTQYSYKLQTTLYQWIAEDIFKHEGKYSKMDKQVQQLLIDFWIRYLKRNKYTQTAKQKEYHQMIINCLELLLVEMDSPSLRYTILHWVAGTDSLKLISNCVDVKFLDCYSYQRIYQIIQKGFKRQKIQSKLEALQAFYRCTRTGDYDDYNNVVKQMPQLLGNVMNLIFNGQIFQYITQYQNMEYFFLCTQTLKNFLDNYEQTRLNIAKQGALMISAILICNQNTQIMKQGLHILNSILDIQEREYSQQIIQMVLSTDKQVYSTGVWSKIGESYEIIKHEKLEIRRLIVQILSKILAIGQMKDVKLLNYHIFYPNGQCLVNMLIQMFLNNEDKVIRQNIIKSLWSILYYSQSIEQHSQTIQRQVERQRTQRLGLNYVCKCIQESGLQQILQKIRQNEEYQYVSQAAVRRQLESIFFILEQKYSR